MVTIIIFIIASVLCWMAYKSLTSQVEVTAVGYPNGEQKSTEPRWASEKQLHVPRSTTSPSNGISFRRQRVPCDPYDAIDPDNPTAYTLRQQYMIMGNNRGKY